MGVDGSRDDVLRLVASDFPQEVLTADDGAAASDEHAKDIELQRRQRDDLAGGCDNVCLLIDNDVAESMGTRSRRCGQGCSGSAERGTDPRKHLEDTERLRDVVIRAESKAQYLVGLFTACRQNQDRGVEALIADTPQHSVPVRFRQHQVK